MTKHNKRSKRGTVTVPLRAFLFPPSQAAAKAAAWAAKAAATIKEVPKAERVVVQDGCVWRWKKQGWVTDATDDWDAAHLESGERRQWPPPPPPPPNYLYDLPDDLRRKIEGPWAAEQLLKRWLTAERPPMSCESWECYSEHGFPQKQPLYFAVGCFRLTDLQSMVEHEALMASPPDPRALELVREELARVKAEDGNPDYDMKRTRGPVQLCDAEEAGRAVA